MYFVRIAGKGEKCKKDGLSGFFGTVQDKRKSLYACNGWKKRDKFVTGTEKG